METLVGGIIPVVPEKYEFDIRKKTIIFNISQTFWLPALRWRDHKKWVFNRIILYKTLARQDSTEGFKFNDFLINFSNSSRKH